MPKLQFFTANLLDGDHKLIPECVPKSLYSCKSISVRCEIPSSGLFAIRLSSGPLPFDMVVKLFLNGRFITGRCFLSGSIEPIFDYEINQVHEDYQGDGPGFPFVWPHSKIQITVHKCFVNQQIPTQSFNNNKFEHVESSSNGGITHWTTCLPPVIIREDLEACLEIVWDCRARHFSTQKEKIVQSTSFFFARMFSLIFFLRWPHDSFIFVFIIESFKKD